MDIFGLFNRKRKEAPDQGLEKTKQSVFSELSHAVAGKSKVDGEVLDNSGEVFAISDVGVGTAPKITERIEQGVVHDRYVSIAELNSTLRGEITALLVENNAEGHENWDLLVDHRPYIILVADVSRVGKTATIDKLAYQFRTSGKKVFLGAAGTYHAAVVNQTKIWGERADVSAVSQQMEVDPASAVFDTLQNVKANGANMVLIDTAGRLHNKVGLTNELRKIKDVMKKVLPQAPSEVLLILDGNTGQNAFERAKQFSAVIQITLLVITKLDGTARGGMVTGISDRLEVPVKYIGPDEQMDDLQLFSRREFVDSLLQRES